MRGSRKWLETRQIRVKLVRTEELGRETVQEEIFQIAKAHRANFNLEA